MLDALYLSAAVTSGLCQSTVSLHGTHELTKLSQSCHRVEDVDRQQ